ncbi:MAG: LuxR C-terminal-related transcriptional regulator [Paracoccaceae bacterium]
MTRPNNTDQHRNWVLIVDDHPLFCDALELTLRRAMPDTNVKTAATLARAQELLAEDSPPLLIALDLNLPDVSGFEGVIQIRKAAAKAGVIVVSSLTDARVISGVVAAGANGFVPKHSNRSVIEEAIQRVTAGDNYFPDSVETDNDQHDAGIAAAERLSTLTAQQARILDLICEGKLNKQIAFDLSIKETTVKAHITAIMRKLGVHSRTQAVLMAQDARFLNILSDTDN